MDKTSERCMSCHQAAMEPATTTIRRSRQGVTVTVDGVPAMRCRACGEISISGKVGIPVDEAMTAILIATGAAAPPDPEVDAALRAEMRELARSLGQEDLLLDEPSGAKNSA